MSLQPVSVPSAPLRSPAGRPVAVAVAGPGPACRGAGLADWFPASERRAGTAKRVCWGCQVRVACLAWALDHDEFGVWGGTTRKERAALRRARDAAPGRPGPRLKAR
jgi:WhiB family redox-sensing transcriptional regulator